MTDPTESATKLNGEETDPGGSEAGPGVSEADSGVSEIDSGVSEADSGVSEIDSGVSKADSGVSEADSAVSEIDPDEDVVFEVVVNHEEQYSIWPADTPAPNGWREVGVRGTKEMCLDHIERVWVDMRPLSLRARERRD